MQRKALKNKKVWDLTTTPWCAYAIELSKGYRVLVSPEDLETVQTYNWCVQEARNGSRYAITHVRDPNTGKQRRVYMHRLLLGLSDRALVDHINGDGLDNRRQNIRYATHGANGANRKRGSNNKSGIKGVSWDSGEQRWRAGIKSKGKSYNLGIYETKEEAAQAYAQAAEKFFGEYARIT